MRFLIPKYLSSRYKKRFAWLPVKLCVMGDIDRYEVVWLEWYYVKQYYNRYQWVNDYFVTKEVYESRINREAEHS